MKKESQSKQKVQPYTKDEIKQWISFGIDNGYINKFKKDEIAKWTELMLKHGVVSMKKPDKILSDGNQ